MGAQEQVGYNTSKGQKHVSHQASFTAEQVNHETREVQESVGHEAYEAIKHMRQPEAREVLKHVTYVMFEDTSDTTTLSHEILEAQGMRGTIAQIVHKLMEFL